jgi:hypothetical protein
MCIRSFWPIASSNVGTYIILLRFNNPQDKDNIMPREKYNLLESTSPHIDPSLSGAYEELIIRNCMTMPIIVIERSGHQTVIPPMISTGSHGVIINFRETVGTRIAERSGDEIPITTKIITIPDWELTQDSVYVKELDLLICSFNHAEMAKHPYSGEVYKDALEHTIINLSDNDHHFTMRIFVNDASGELNNLYVHMFGKHLSVPITCYAANESLISFVCMAKNKEVCRFSRPLSYVTEGGDGRIDLGNGFVVHVSNNLDKLERSLKSVIDREELSIEQVTQKVKELTAAHKLALQQLEQQHALDIQAKVIDLSEKNNQLSQQAQLIAQQKAQMAEWGAIYEARLTEEKQREAQVKTSTAQLGYHAEEFKYKSLLIKTAGAVAIAAGTWAIKVYLDRRKSDK